MARTPMVAAAVLAVLFLVLNFTVDDAGTLFLILAVACGAAAVYLGTRRDQRP